MATQPIAPLPNFDILVKQKLESFPLRGITLVKEKPLDDDSSSTCSEELTSTVVCAHSPVRSHMHRDAIHIRSELQSHLRSCMKSGDDMLFKIREFTESLDHAFHEQRLATELYDEATRKQREIQKQLDTTTKECKTLKATLLELSKSRDNAEIQLEAASGHLLEKERECDDLRLQITHVQERVEFFTHKYNETSSELIHKAAEAKAFKTAADNLTIELEASNKTIKGFKAENQKLLKDNADIRMTNKTLREKDEQFKRELSTVKSRLSAITIQFEKSKQDLKEANNAEKEAHKQLDAANKDRTTAEEKEAAAKVDRDGARAARDAAIADFQSINAQFNREEALRKEVQYSLKHLQASYNKACKDRDSAAQSSAEWHHMRDELVDQLQEVEKARHCLLHDLNTAVEQKLAAEQRTQEARKEVLKVQHDYDELTIAKTQVEQNLLKTEVEKNAAIAKEAKALEDLVAADSSRDAAVLEAKLLEDKFQNAAAETTSLSGQLDVARVSLRNAELEKGVEVDKCQHLQEQLRDPQETNEKLKRDFQAEKTKLQETQAKLLKDFGQGTKNEKYWIQALFWDNELVKDRKAYTTLLEVAKKRGKNGVDVGETLLGLEHKKNIQSLVVIYSKMVNGKWTEQQPLYVKEGTNFKLL